MPVAYHQIDLDLGLFNLRHFVHWFFGISINPASHCNSYFKLVKRRNQSKSIYPYLRLYGAMCSDNYLRLYGGVFRHNTEFGEI